MAIVKIDQMAAGQTTTVAASDTIVTGLNKVLTSVQLTPGQAIDETNKFFVADLGNQAGTPAAGSFLLKSFKDTDADALPIAATGFGIKVNWLAF